MRYSILFQDEEMRIPTLNLKRSMVGVHVLEEAPFLQEQPGTSVMPLSFESLSLITPLAPVSLGSGQGPIFLTAIVTVYRVGSENFQLERCQLSRMLQINSASHLGSSGAEVSWACSPDFLELLRLCSGVIPSVSGYSGSLGK